MSLDQARSQPRQLKQAVFKPPSAGIFTAYIDKAMALIIVAKNSGQVTTIYFLIAEYHSSDDTWLRMLLLFERPTQVIPSSHSLTRIVNSRHCSDFQSTLHLAYFLSLA